MNGVEPFLPSYNLFSPNYHHHGAAGVSDEFPLAFMWAGNRTLRIADGPDEVHRNAVAKLELSKHMTLPGEDSELPVTRS